MEASQETNGSSPSIAEQSQGITQNEATNVETSNADVVDLTNEMKAESREEQEQVLGGSPANAEQTSTQEEESISKETPEKGNGQKSQTEEAPTRAKRTPKRPHKDYSELVGTKEPPAGRKSQRTKPPPADTEAEKINGPVVFEADPEPVIKKRGGRKKSTATGGVPTSGATPARLRQSSHAGSVDQQPDAQIQETLYQKVLLELGKTRPSDLATLTRAVIEHAKNPSASPLREHLENAMTATTRWTGEQCVRYLAAIQLSIDPYHVEDSVIAAAFQREPTVLDLIERFTFPDWSKGRVAAPVSQANSLESTAFALWATNLRATNAAAQQDLSDDVLWNAWQKEEQSVRQHFEVLAAHMQQMEALAKNAANRPGTLGVS